MARRKELLRENARLREEAAATARAAEAARTEAEQARTAAASAADALGTQLPGALRERVGALSPVERLAKIRELIQLRDDLRADGISNAQPAPAHPEPVAPIPVARGPFQRMMDAPSRVAAARRADREQAAPAPSTAPRGPIGEHASRYLELKATDRRQAGYYRLANRRAVDTELDAAMASGALPTPRDD